MRRIGPSISLYLLRTVLPYFIFSWLLLSVILFFQQAGRYSEIFFSVSIPRWLILQLTFAIIPNVIAFTCPMAALIGVVIGISKMQGDSEIVALRAAGIGNLSLAAPIAAVGVVLSLFAFLVNVKGVPFAAGVAKRVGIQSALFKLDSPIEPGVFNTGIAGLTIFVRDGDLDSGVWRQLFIFNEDKSKGTTRLITAKLGRVDTSETRSELVLNDAVVTLVPRAGDAVSPGALSAERIREVRFAINTGRAELLEKMENADEGPEVLGLLELAALAKASMGREREEAEILWTRRVILSITPLLFAVLGASMVLRFNRGGRGFGILLALGALISYYLLTLLAEQLARTTRLSATTTGLVPLLVCVGVTVLFFASGRIVKDSRDLASLKEVGPRPLEYLRLRRRPNEIASTGERLLDRDIIGSILKFFLLTFSFLGSIYLIFTAFDMWKFAGTTEGGTWMLLKYLFFLVPMVYIQLSPPALMIAVLATFVIKSRQNEVVTWTASGQSVYRLLVPCFGLMLAIGALNLGIQELILPSANQRQDAFRALLRSRGVPPSDGSKSWAATGNRIYSFDTPALGGLREREVTGLTVYEFGADGSLTSVYLAPRALWRGDSVQITGDAQRLQVSGEAVLSTRVSDPVLAEPEHPFTYANQRPSHLSTLETRRYLEEVDSGIEFRNMAVALHRKYATLFMPLFIVVFTAPFGLSLSRKGKVVAVGYAVGAWLVYTGVGNAFEQFGLSGAISPAAAVWLPLLAFVSAGVILLSRVRT